jgi:hypothetical protein
VQVVAKALLLRRADVDLDRLAVDDHRELLAAGDVGAHRGTRPDVAKALGALRRAEPETAPQKETVHGSHPRLTLGGHRGQAHHLDAGEQLGELFGRDAALGGEDRLQMLTRGLVASVQQALQLGELLLGLVHVDIFPLRLGPFGQGVTCGSESPRSGRRRRSRRIR